MQYRKIFDPGSTQVFAEEAALPAADRGDRSVYVYTDEIVLAVNVALATGRPLLVRGPSGSGKSTLARNVARTLGRRYYEQVISSRTQARDLLWQIDLLRRLQDAQAKQLAPDYSRYVVPGVLWWAFNRAGALEQLLSSSRVTHGAAAWQRRRSWFQALTNRSLAAGLAQTRTGDSTTKEPGDFTGHSKAVVLLDEIDKADPDVPNNLLVPLGSLTFTVDETGQPVPAVDPPLVFLTTNDERDLPPAFIRRCVELNIPSPSAEQLLKIGHAHFATAPQDLLTRLADLFANPADGILNPPSTAEYLDTVRACMQLDVTPGGPLFETLAKVTVWKHGRTPGGSTLS